MISIVNSEAALESPIDKGIIWQKWMPGQLQLQLESMGTTLFHRHGLFEFEWNKNGTHFLSFNPPAT